MEIGIWEREHAKGHIIQDNFLDKYFFLLQDTNVGRSMLTFNFEYAMTKNFKNQKVYLNYLEVEQYEQLLHPLHV